MTKLKVFYTFLRFLLGQNKGKKLKRREYKEITKRVPKKKNISFIILIFPSYRSFLKQYI